MRVSFSPMQLREKYFADRSNLKVAVLGGLPRNLIHAIEDTLFRLQDGCAAREPAVV